ncbi:MAG: insulinase family protein [Gemmatimonadota bacterium]|nr:MAG: insulinase family protein [Gemmatimonadota bacterium]
MDMTGSFCRASEAGSPFRLPDFEKFVMDNGLTVYLMEQHEVPLIYVSFVFPAGVVNDGETYGLSFLTAEGLLFGTQNYTKKQIEESLDFIGASYETSSSKEFAKLSLSFVNTDQETVFPILKDIVMLPTFDEEEFLKRKKRLLVELEQAKEKPSKVIGSYYDKFLFQDHPYGNPTSGIIGSVSDISVKDVNNFYAAHYNPGGSAIAIVGDFETSKMKEDITRLFRNWKGKGMTFSIQHEPISSIRTNRLLLVNKEDATETRFMIGSFGIKRSNPDYVPVQVVNTVLGGRFTSWLNDELRINRGLTYGVYSYFNELKDTGTFQISSFTPTETTIEAIDVTLEILDRLHTQGLDEETLISAKNYIKGQYPPRYETAGSLASLLTSMFVYDFDESFINDFQKNVDEMTLEKARQVIDDYFPSDNLQFVLIGKASEIRHAVQKYGEIIDKEIKDDGF